jgi:hypothetical protein
MQSELEAQQSEFKAQESELHIEELLKQRHLQCAGFHRPDLLADLFDYTGALKLDLASIVWTHLFYKPGMDPDQQIEFCEVFLENETQVIEYLQSQTPSESYVKLVQTEMLPENISYRPIVEAVERAYPTENQDQKLALEGLTSLLLSNVTLADFELFNLPTDLYALVE